MTLLRLARGKSVQSVFQRLFHVFRSSRQNYYAQFSERVRWRRHVRLTVHGSRLLQSAAADRRRAVALRSGAVALHDAGRAAAQCMA